CRYLSLSTYRHYSALHSCPTRRSSDLAPPNWRSMRTRPGSKNAVHQRVKPGIGSQGVCQGFHLEVQHVLGPILAAFLKPGKGLVDRKSTRLNSSHQIISYAVFCLKKKT